MRHTIGYDVDIGLSGDGNDGHEEWVLVGTAIDFGQYFLGGAGCNPKQYQGYKLKDLFHYSI